MIHNYKNFGFHRNNTTNKHRFYCFDGAYLKEGGMKSYKNVPSRLYDRLTVLSKIKPDKFQAILSLAIIRLNEKQLSKH